MTTRQSGFDVIERALRRHTFGTPSTLTEQGRPHATGVEYAVSAPGAPLALYVTTRTTTRKVRNIQAHPDVPFVVPVPHRLIALFPPSAIQFQGSASIISSQDDGAVRAFNSSWFFRRILATEHRIVAQGGDLCFIRIRPDPPVFTYALGMSPVENMRRPRQAIGRVAIPADRLL
ncbi:pyridoxamine 5'-phosphate oxidase family protein [Mycobacterium sp.]|uniref:pyridoxamine 5'-phosphate oxidase family protein n=1 Tax=Mycobacterium sp. TaxID=1785 RepID=UPI003C7917A1